MCIGKISISAYVQYRERCFSTDGITKFIELFVNRGEFIFIYLCALLFIMKMRTCWPPFRSVDIPSSFRDSPGRRLLHSFFSRHSRMMIVGFHCHDSSNFTFINYHLFIYHRPPGSCRCLTILPLTGFYVVLSVCKGEIARPAGSYNKACSIQFSSCFFNLQYIYISSWLISNMTENTTQTSAMARYFVVASAILLCLVAHISAADQDCKKRAQDSYKR